MMYFYVFTEGDSESNYIQLLRRFIRNEGLEENFTLSFNKREDCFGGLGKGAQSVTTLSNKISEKIKTSLGRTKDDRKGKDIIIWIDYDILQRNMIKSKALYINLNSRLSGANVTVYYNVMNFEDFFVLHYPEMVSKWQDICDRKNHFVKPLSSEEHFKLFRENVFPDYSKTNFLPDFQLSEETLNAVIANSKSKNSNFESDIVDLLENVVGMLD